MESTVNSVGGKGQLRQHFLDMGLIPGVRVTLVKYAPMGDPVEVRLHGYELTLRLEDAGKIGIRNISREGSQSMWKRLMRRSGSLSSRTRDSVRKKA